MRTKVLAVSILSILLPPGVAEAAEADDPGLAKQWNMRMIGIPKAWDAATGEGVTVAIVDSGADLTHPDLAASIVPGTNFVRPGHDPGDDHGHGTHVAGIVAAAANNHLGVVGVAPGVRIMPVKVLDENKSGSETAAGIRWAADHGADVINLSVGDVIPRPDGPSFGDAIEYAWSKGVICVAGAGNMYVLGSVYESEPVLVVSATNPDDEKPDYSSGVGRAKWALAAPGGGSEFGPEEDKIFSTWKGGGYRSVQGTSMAAPHVAGAAALLRGLGLTPEQTVARLLATARDIGAAGWDSTFGAGRLDVEAAVSQVGERRTTNRQPTGPALRLAGPPSARPGARGPAWRRPG